MLHAGGLNLLKFNTNYSELREHIHQEESTGHFGPAFMLHSDETYSSTMLGGAQCMAAGEQKMLRVRWCVKTDRFILDVSESGCQVRNLLPKKRHIVSLAGRIYDPL